MWVRKAFLFSLASALAGLISGVLLGAIGSLLAEDLRVATASLFAIFAIVIGGVELAGWRMHPFQCNHETPRAWVMEGPYTWAIKNGLTLGSGALSRLGFWLWYTVPLGALLIGNPFFGGAIYGTYGLIRGAAVWPILLSLYWRRDQDRAWLLDYIDAAQTIAAAQLVVVGLSVAVAIGL
jgi:hypothetical protein